MAGTPPLGPPDIVRDLLTHAKTHGNARQIQLPATEADITSLVNDLAAKVPTTRLVAGHALSADVTLVKADCGLGNVDNTSDANKPVSTAAQAVLDEKVGGGVANGAAKTVSAALAEKSGTVRLGSAGALAMTLADPTNATDDGKRLTVVASTAHAHKVTIAGGLAGGALNTVTLGGAIGDMAEFEAIAGKWFLRPSINATASTV